MNHATNFLIQKQVRKFEGDLSHWVNKVRSSSRDLDAVRIATQAPAPGSLIRSLQYSWGRNLQQAKRAVEQEILGRVENMDVGAPEFLSILRMSRGNLPSVYRCLDEKMCAEKAVSPPDIPGLENGP